MLIAIGGGLGVALGAFVYMVFGARMAAKQRTWVPASISIVQDTTTVDDITGTDTAAHV